MFVYACDRLGYERNVKSLTVFFRNIRLDRQIRPRRCNTKSFSASVMIDETCKCDLVLGHYVWCVLRFLDSNKLPSLLKGETVRRHDIVIVGTSQQEISNAFHVRRLSLLNATAGPGVCSVHVASLTAVTSDAPCENYFDVGNNKIVRTVSNTSFFHRSRRMTIRKSSKRVRCFSMENSRAIDLSLELTGLCYFKYILLSSHEIYGCRISETWKFDAFFFHFFTFVRVSFPSKFSFDLMNFEHVGIQSDRCSNCDKLTNNQNAQLATACAEFWVAMNFNLGRQSLRIGFTDPSKSATHFRKLPIQWFASHPLLFYTLAWSFRNSICPARRKINRVDVNCIRAAGVSRKFLWI